MKNNYFLKFILASTLLLSFQFFSTAQKTIENHTAIIQTPAELNLPLNDCAISSAQTSLDVNNVSANLLVSRSLWDGNDGAAYQVPNDTANGDETSLFFTGGLWMGGFDSGGSLKMAAQTYGFGTGASDFWPGPLDENGETTVEGCQNFDRFWETTSTDINSHISDWNDNEMIDGLVPNSILAWPGKDNPEFLTANGFQLPNSSTGFAPFFDRNGDGIYQPMQGDYPNINDADQGIWWTFNDAGNIHTQTGGDKMQVEVQVLAYAYISTNENINNATYYDYTFINKSSETLDSTFVGIWVDMNLSCSYADYIGCDPSQDLAYAYYPNPDIQNNGCIDCYGNDIFCDGIPMIGVKILEGVKDIENNEVIDRGMSSFTFYNNAGTIPPPPAVTIDPNSAPQFYNYLTGSWLDGTRLSQGGDGYDPSSTDYTTYAYSSSPDDPNGWSMCSENAPDNDRRVVIGSGPYTSQPGSVNTLSFAVVYTNQATYPCPSLDPLTEAANDVQGFYQNTVGTKETLTQISANIRFHPNPMSEYAKLTFDDLENNVQQVDVFSIDGRQVQSYGNISGSSLEIQRDNLSPGIYFYKLLTDDFKIHSGKFVLQ